GRVLLLGTGLTRRSGSAVGAPPRCENRQPHSHPGRVLLLGTGLTRRSGPAVGAPPRCEPPHPFAPGAGAPARTELTRISGSAVGAPPRCDNRQPHSHPGRVLLQGQS